ncbi:beta-lactamase [Mycolicibacterium conceptionense]|jgi:beta-lactamase class A|uniref:Beta-lactamase n=2 Tax=Mycolicibacterium TaxID=1866885 RepID=A0ABR5FSJ7_9MYCO|nr:MULTISPECIES: class A beta-lactamase [Mycolicibacterium]KLI06008.1 beta-lactamase [Mycolicibacterium senegalense]KLO50923.1 beta-lactamase [Mycolicibacterium senegalense]KMV17890.1 beta-lactamase [Mycolicibacterium conceptionense]OBK07602.1 class A beta-lactamase [Mycolicibacterium conceptionense]OMB73863.1 class A beta-lactamase [Mycolicibacterium conceptionense]
MTGLSRRNVLIGSLVAAAAVGTGVGGAAPAFAAPIDDQLAELERRDNVLIGLYASNLDSGRRITHRADQMFAMCSTFKGYAAARVLQMAERGEISLDNRVFVDADALVPNSPVTETRAGAEMTLAELCQAALQRSDNTAANLLLKTIGGPAAVTAFARSVGDERTRLDRWEVELNSAIPGDPRDTSTPAALAVGYRAILAGDALSPSQRGLLEDWMRANQTSSMRAGLPEGWTTADKTGSGDYGSTNDAGIAFGPDGQRLLLVMMTRSQAHDPKAENLRPLIGELTALVLPSLL